MYFESRGASEGTRASRIPASRGARPSRRSVEPDVGDDDAPRVEPARGDDEPDLAPVERDGERRRSTAAPATSPVEASTPEGRSTATTGVPQALIRSIIAAASGRGAPWNPVPKSASITTS